MRGRRSFITAVAGTAVGGSIFGSGTVAAETDITITRDVTYNQADGTTLRADLYQPPSSGPHPTVVWVHGGSWRRGDKEWLAQEAKDFANQGYAGMSINYRLTPEHSYPDPLVDVKTAVEWVRENASEYGFDPERIALAGHSAGAHLAALAAVSDSPAPTPVQSVVGSYGIYDLRPFIAEGVSSPAIEAFLGAPASEVPERAYAASPVVHLSPDDPPHFLLHGTDDERVPYRSSTQYRDALRQAGVTAELFTADGAEHAFEHERRWHGVTRGRTTDFLNEHLR